MTNDTVNENVCDEKTIHERIAIIEVKIIALKDAIQKLCEYMVKDKQYQGKVLEMEDMIKRLKEMKLQLNYFDEVIEDAKRQRQNEPLIIKEKK